MVYHVLRDGTITNDITGHVVKMKDAEPLYNLMRSKSRRIKKADKKDRRVSA